MDTFMNSVGTPSGKLDKLLGPAHPFTSVESASDMKHSHVRRHRHRDRYLLMGRSALWGSDPLSEDEDHKLTMLEVVSRRCLIALGVTLLIFMIIDSLDRPFWDELRQAGQSAFCLGKPRPHVAP
jgi:hypothetical protein